METQEIYPHMKLFRRNGLQPLNSLNAMKRKNDESNFPHRLLTVDWADFVVGVEHVDNLLKHGFNGQSVLNHGANILKMKVD